MHGANTKQLRRLLWEELLILQDKFPVPPVDLRWRFQRPLRYRGEIRWASPRYRQASRLDRILGNHHWFDLVHSSSVTHLNRLEPDHSPLLLEVLIGKLSIIKRFKFQSSSWCNHQDFHGIVQVVWSSIHHVNPHLHVAPRLKATRKTLSNWSRSAFGDIFQNLRSAKDNVTCAEMVFDKDGLPSQRSTLNEAKARLKLCIAN